MLLNSQGRPYKKEKALRIDFKFSVMVDLLDGLSVTETAIKNNVDKNLVKKLSQQFVTNGSLERMGM